MPGQEVGVKVREKDVLNRVSALIRVTQVLRDIPLGIDHSGDPACLIGNEVRRVRQTTEVELHNQHESPFLRGISYRSRGDPFVSRRWEVSTCRSPRRRGGFQEENGHTLSPLFTS